MVGLAGLAKLQIEPAHPAQEPLDRIHEVGEQAAHMIGQILAFSKQRHTASTAVDLNGVVRHCLKVLRGVLPMTITVETEYADEGPLVQGDETQLKQIVINLCLNAREAMPEGGKLFLRTDVISNPADKRLIRLTIQDTGQGMTEAVLARIFEPFFSTKERGTGLGLTVVRQIVESFNGRIQAWSQPLQGTRFEILLREAERAIDKSEEAEQPVSSSEAKVLSR
jgi:signal transduction histidine kinase